MIYLLEIVMRFHWTILFLFIFFCPIDALAGPVVYPVKEVIGFDIPSLDVKAPAFAGWVKKTGLPRLSGEFVASIRKEFGPIAVDTIDEKNKHRVLVVSLH